MPPKRSLSVLVCEDDKIIAEMLAAFLLQAGCEVEICHDGESAIELASRWSPTGAVIDIGLPGISGYAVAQHLREQFGPQLVIVALTSHDMPDEIAKARYAGFDWHFAKPARLTHIVEILCNSTRAPDQKRTGIRLTPPPRALRPEATSPISILP